MGRTALGADVLGGVKLACKPQRSQNQTPTVNLRHILLSAQDTARPPPDGREEPPAGTPGPELAPRPVGVGGRWDDAGPAAAVAGLGTDPSLVAAPAQQAQSRPQNKGNARVLKGTTTVILNAL